MPDAQTAALELKSDFAREAIDLALHHLAWSSNHLVECRHERALESFNNAVMAVRAAASEMSGIRSIVVDLTSMGESAANYRAERDQRRPAVKRSAAA